MSPAESLRLSGSKLNRGNPKQKIGDFGPMGRILIDGDHRIERNCR
jgi:hypothetical protein